MSNDLKIGDIVTGEGRYQRGIFTGPIESIDMSCVDRCAYSIRLPDGQTRWLQQGTVSLVQKSEHALEESRMESATNRERAEAAEQEARALAQDLGAARAEAAYQATRAEAAEGKLSDIAAISRVAELVRDLHESEEDWSFQGLIQCVLKREA